MALNNKLRQQYDQFLLAERIVNLGGRATMIEAFLGINKRSGALLYKAITGHSSHGGLLPYDPNWVVKTPNNCLHASYFFNIYHHLKQGDHKRTNGNSLFIAAYKLYLNRFDAPLLSIERAWYVYLQVTSGQYQFIQCTRCHCHHITIKNYPRVYQVCPVCDIDIDSLQRKKWSKK